MDLIWQGILEAVRLIVTGDREILDVTLRTLQISGSATLISLIIGVPLGTLLALSEFRGRRFILSILNTAMGLPPVVVGLWVSIFLWRSGPFGFLNLIYTPVALVIAQAIIASPVVIGLTSAAIQQTDPKLRLLIKALGTTRIQFLWLLLKEVRFSLLAAVIAGFGAVVSEVGASMMVGGNIKGSTRVLTTATVLEVSKGNFEIAIALTIILSLLAYAVTLWLTLLQQRQHEGK
ncbi:ABC transporter permease [Paradesulfitobacterium ferrireducens]|uniref:ABC transporter permease n=1 Tax=Paradesulfitobacterium ferrireducens TaxID=2816476 RepID=UPI001A8FA321|nr:ABC transporter permease [Paradesulfitobacterium ferrireducens]